MKKDKEGRSRSLLDILDEALSRTGKEVATSEVIFTTLLKYETYDILVQIVNQRDFLGNDINDYAFYAFVVRSNDGWDHTPIEEECCYYLASFINAYPEIRDRMHPDIDQELLEDLKAIVAIQEIKR